MGMTCDEYNIYALLIGVGNYTKMKIPNIPSYKMDVTLMGAGLVSGLKCAKEHIQVVAGEDDNGIVSTAALARGIESFKKVLSANDTFIFYFSGHGSAENLVFSDGQVDQQSIINYIDSLRCKNKIVILDCCYSGKFQTLGANHLSMEESVELFAGHGIAVYASSAENEVSRLGEDGNHSMFTGALSSAITSSSIIHKGQIDLDDIYRETQRLVLGWNKKNPGKEQNPIFRSNIGGTIYFPVQEYKEYEPEQVTFDKSGYVVVNVKPLSSSKEKRLCAFVLLKNECSVEEMVSITKDVADSIKYANVFSDEKSAAMYAGSPAKAVWCYFCKDKKDVINHTYPYYTIWAADDVRNKYYRAGTNARVLDDIYILKNTSYDLIRKMQVKTVSKEVYVSQCTKYLEMFVDKAEDFCIDLREVYNRKLTFDEMQTRYKDWMTGIKKEYIKLSDMEVAPDEIHDWVEEILQLSGWILDLSIYLEGNSQQEGTITEREAWLIQNAVKKYHASLEKLRILEHDVKNRT